MGKRVLILGGGYAGVMTAVGLQRSDAEVTLINRHNYHYFTTLLHQPAAGQTDYEEVSVELDKLLPHVQVIRGQVMEIDADAEQVKTYLGDDQWETFGYDYLVVAVGWQPHFFNIPGLDEHALTLRSLNTARLINAQVQMALATYKNNSDQPWQTEIIIGGGGFTGVELAGEMADWRPELARRYGLNSSEIKITIVEAAPSILPGFDDHLVSQAVKILKRKGVEIVTGLPITKVEKNTVHLGEDQQIEAGTIIWTGGVRANELVEKSGFKVNRRGQAVVTPYLESVDYSNVYFGGDTAQTLTEDGTPLPGTAQVAIQHGEQIAKNIDHRIKGKDQEAFRPEILGTFLSIGKKDALGILRNRYRYSGWAARTIKDAIAYRYVFKIGGISLVVWKLLERWGIVKT